jgi:hypothetical protein
MAELGHLPDPVVNVVRRCMEKDPRDRYQSATELVGALERASQAYAQFRRQQGGGAPEAAGYTAPRPTASTIPVAPPTQPSPRPVPPRQPQPEAATRVESRPPAGRPAAAPAAQPVGAAPPGAAEAAAGVHVELAEKAKPGRDGLARYTLTVTNAGGALLRLRLVPTDASGVLQVNVPGRVAVPPGTTVLLDVTAQPRVRRTRGPDRRLGFGVTAVDEATGATVGSGGAEYQDIVERGGGSGRLLAIAGVAGVVIVVAVFAAVVFLAGGDGEGGNGGGGTSPTSTRTADTRPSIRTGEYTYNLSVDESTCSFGSQPGTMHTLTFVFDRVGGGDALRTGDQVQITGIAEGGTRVALGRAPFAIDGFVFTYPVTIGNERGTAELSTVFDEGSNIVSAKLVETYGSGDAACTITATQ